MQLATVHGRAILAADSRQVYRRFDIGTAKPTQDERGRVPQMGIDLADPTDRFSAARWASVVEGDLTQAPPNRRPIVVGGTGMYLRALFAGLFTDPTVHDDRRASLLEWLDLRSTEELRHWTTRLDSPRAHLGRVQLIRALAVALLTGHRISQLHETRAPMPRWIARYLVVDPGPVLHERIGQRLDAMLHGGWLDEVQSLTDVHDDAPAWKATGYRALRQVVRGTMSLTDAREHILIETRQFAKRQRTWFRHQLPAEHTTRVNPESSDAASVIGDWWATVTAR